MGWKLLSQRSLGLGGGVVVALLSFLGIYRLLQKKASSHRQIDINRRDGNSQTIFALLKNAKNEFLIRQELNDHPESAKLTDHKGRLPLHIVLSKQQPNFEIGLKVSKPSF
jgi:hypothetical protein